TADTVVRPLDVSAIVRTTRPVGQEWPDVVLSRNDRPLAQIWRMDMLCDDFDRRFEIDGTLDNTPRVVPEQDLSGRPTAREHTSVDARCQGADFRRIVAPHGRSVCDGVHPLYNVWIIDIGEALDEAHDGAQPTSQQAHEGLGGAIAEKAIRGGEYP